MYVCTYIYLYLYVCKITFKMATGCLLKGIPLKAFSSHLQTKVQKITLLTDSDSVLFNVVSFTIILIIFAKYTATTRNLTFVVVPHTRNVFAFALIFLYIFYWCFCFLFSLCAFSFTRCTLTRIKILNVTQIFDLYHLN